MITSAALLLLPIVPASAATSAGADIPGRPVLTGLLQEARRTGTTLEQQLDTYVARQVAQGMGGPHQGDPQGVTEQDLPTLPPDLVVDGIPLAELVDLKLIAKSEDIEFAQAIDRFAWQGEFVKAADEIERAHPGEFAGAVFAHDGRSAWFAFKGAVPESAKSAAAILPRPVDLFGERGFSEAELKETLDRAHDGIRDRADVASVAGSYEIRTGAITLEVEPTPAAMSAGLAADWTATLQALTTPANPKISIQVRRVDKRLSGNEDKYMRGGGFFTGCTAGFTLRDAKGKSHAIATAHHCDGIYRNYQQHSGDGGSVTYSKLEAMDGGAHGDLARFSKGTMTVARTFYYDWNRKRYVDTVWSPREGVRVCRFGVASGAKCSETYRLNTTRDGYMGLVATHRHISASGDSGGPWYYGGTAFGIHSGWAHISFFDRSLFTPAGNVVKGLGMYINTR